MRKSEELVNPNSCMSKALPSEMTFVLLSRDAAAPRAIRAWTEERIRLGKNSANDAQILEAIKCAEAMEADRTKPAISTLRQLTDKPPLEFEEMTCTQIIHNSVETVEEFVEAVRKEGEL